MPAPVVLPPKSMPWIIGALGGDPVRGHFNGKIEAPAMVARALAADGHRKLATGGAAARRGRALGFFAGDVDTTASSTSARASIMAGSSICRRAP